MHHEPRQQLLSPEHVRFVGFAGNAVVTVGEKFGNSVRAELKEGVDHHRSPVVLSHVVVQRLRDASHKSESHISMTRQSWPRHTHLHGLPQPAKAVFDGTKVGRVDGTVQKQVPLCSKHCVKFGAVVSPQVVHHQHSILTTNRRQQAHHDEEHECVPVD